MNGLEICDLCHEEPDCGNYFCPVCAKNLCEVCYGDASNEICRTCLKKERLEAKANAKANARDAANRDPVVDVSPKEAGMRSPIRSTHWNDADGNPAGGSTFGNGFAVSWQNGPLGCGADRREPNGAFVEDLVAAAIDRLEFYQKGRFNCGANNTALTYLKSALDSLEARTKDRETRAVEGTHAK